MAVTIRDAESAYLSGHSTFEEWKDKFEFEWNLPMVMSEFAMLIGVARRTAIMEQMPDTVLKADEIMRRIAGAAGG